MSLEVGAWGGYEVEIERPANPGSHVAYYVELRYPGVGEDVISMATRIEVLGGKE